MYYYRTFSHREVAQEVYFDEDTNDNDHTRNSPSVDLKFS